MAETTLLNKRYELEKPLGSGGMSIVYRARDLMLERVVAVKLLREDYSRSPAFRERFHQEAKAAANLSHPNIVMIHDFGMDSGRLFIVMEYVPGMNMNAILQSRGRYTVDEALPLIRQACAGIGYAHRAGLVHCDIKPHNFLITPDNRLKVVDFGIARALASIHPEEKSDVVWGSPQYFSPEQAAGGAPSPASDVYSLGVVMYTMLTGRLPFIATNATELTELHKSAPPPPPRQFNPAIPVELEQIMLKVLAKEPSQRYRTADQLGRVLITFTENSRPKVQKPSQPPGASVKQPIPATPAPAQPGLSPARPPSAYPAPAVRPAINPPVQPPSPAPQPVYKAQEQPESIFDIDWITLGLGLLTLIVVGGLIPFWLWVYLVYNPPGR